jgi:biopolymer transport protein ExbD
VKLRRSPAPHPLLLYLAPSLGLAMILIFFLLLSTNFLVQPGVAVTLPQSPFLLSPQRDPRIISITGPPLPAIYFESENLDLAALRRRLEGMRGRSQTLIIKADRKAVYETVTTVMNVALELGYPVVLATADDEP